MPVALLGVAALPADAPARVAPAPGPVASTPAGGEAAARLPVRPAPCAAPDDPALADVLRNRLEAARATGHLHAAGDPLLARVALPELYLRRESRPAWVGPDGLGRCGRELVARLAAAEEDGLRGEEYHRADIERLAADARLRTDPALRADLDLLLSDAFLVFGSHLLAGRVSPETLEPEWTANRRSADMTLRMEETLASGDVAAGLEALRPAEPEYRALRDRLAALRRVEAAGGWPRVAGGPTLEPGVRDARVVALRARLGGTDPPAAAAPPPDPSVYDEGLADQVRRFQTRHGLDPDGRVGLQTTAALNVPVTDRIATLVVNLERWRWLPEELGPRHIRVNIADYRVEVRERGRVALEMRAVVGREYRETPIFSATMTYLVLAPYWHVPPVIAAVDKLPEIKRNPGYLAAQGMTLLDATTNRAVDPRSIDWSTVTGAELNRRWRIRQDPGPLNALGDVKFMFPNRFNVYLHDTPSRELFGRTTRAFSSGCVRLQHPMQLAEYLLSGDPSWTPDRIRASVRGGRETTVRLAEGVPVHILYWTAFVDDGGDVQFRPDIYGRDARVLEALRAPGPGA